MFAVHIYVARLDPVRHMGDRFVDTLVNAECQRIAGGVDRVDHTVDFIAPEPHGMQDGAKDFLLQIENLADSRSASAQTKVPERTDAGREWNLLDGETGPPHLFDMRQDGSPALDADDTVTDIDRQPVRRSHGKFRHRAAQHAQNAIVDILLKTEQPERGASLTGLSRRRKAIDIRPHTARAERLNRRSSR